MKAGAIWSAAIRAMKEQDGSNPYTSMMGKAPSEKTRFDFHGYPAAFYWGGGNIVCIDIEVSDVVVSLSKPTLHPARWRGTAPDSALVELALRSGLVEC